MSGPYDGYDLPALWGMLAHESEAVQAEHHAAWNRKESMLRAQIENLTRLRAQLEAAWRPEHSEAARSFAGQVGATISVMQQAQQAAIRIRDSHAAVTEALLNAKSKIGRLRAAYNDERVAWRDFLQSTPGGALLKAMPPDWLPNVGIPDAAAFAVMKMHRNRLDQQARVIMEETDRQVTTATSGRANMPRLTNFDEGVAPPMPTRPGGFASGRHVARPEFNPPAPTVALSDIGESLGSGPDTLDPGPFLTGTPAQVASPAVLTPSIGMPSTPPVVRPEQLPAALLPTTYGPFGPPITRPGVIGGPSTRGGVTRPGATEGQSARPGVAPNGVMGGRPAQSAVGGARRPAAGGVSGRATQSQGRVTGSGWRDRSYEEYTQRRRRENRDGNEVWPVAEGVPPVLEPPPPPPPNDPTPGVIGIDR
ncbi:hypothetical protein ACQP00_04760 [Dactylosporangium sp. CS-047395]|uniref:hypothetical protein n=1 Tax=Dactylosporangium sp. CS-047395 TaxID=3239936 RepID=UPI003D8BB47D